MQPRFSKKVLVFGVKVENVALPESESGGQSQKFTPLSSAQDPTMVEKGGAGCHRLQCGCCAWGHGRVQPHSAVFLLTV
jgi:hypothetical protein